MKRRQPNKWLKARHNLQAGCGRDADGHGPMTTAEIGAAILQSEGIEASAAEAQTVALAIHHSLKNHEGSSRWRLK